MHLQEGTFGLHSPQPARPPPGSGEGGHPDVAGRASDQQGGGVSGAPGARGLQRGPRGQASAPQPREGVGQGPGEAQGPAGLARQLQGGVAAVVQSERAGQGQLTGCRRRQEAVSVQ